jgi:hypothetical protein
MAVRRSQLPPSFRGAEAEAFRALLAGWRGRVFLQASLDARGFALPARYQQIVAALCPEPDKAGLNQYWDEMARELVLSGGRANSWLRQVPDGAYRSQYLDDLARSQLLSRDLPLHPCVRAFHEKTMENREIYREIVQRLDIEKQRDIENIGVSPYEWTGSEDDVYSILGQMFKDKGFSRKRDEFIRHTELGLSFRVFMGAGRNARAILVPLTFSIFMPECAGEVCYFRPEDLVPGYQFYYAFRSVEAGLLGFQAYVEFLDLLSSSFDRPSTI